VTEAAPPAVRSFGERLQQEFQSRKERNPRYSLRAFATLVGTDHAVLAQIFKGTRRVPIRHIRTWARKLGIDRDEALVYVTAAHVPDASVLDRQEQLRHWSAEALSIATDSTHFEIIRLSRSRAFRNDSRWIATQIGIPLDQVNIALSRLLRLRLLEMTEAGVWRDRTGLAALDDKEFRKLALDRVRKMAAELNVKLPALSKSV
jgi:hypothetical protein